MSSTKETASPSKRIQGKGYRPDKDHNPRAPWSKTDIRRKLHLHVASNQ